MPALARTEADSPTRVRYLVLAWLCLLAALAYVHRGCFSVPAKRIGGELNLSGEALGDIMAAFFWGYTLFQLPGGWLADGWGARRSLTLFIVIWSAATGLMGFMEDFLGLWLCWLVNGIAQAGLFPCCVKTISRWFPERSRAFPNGMLGSFMSVGAIIGATLTAWLLRVLTWQEVFVWLSLPGFALALAFYWWIRDDPTEHAWVNAEELALIREGKADTAITTLPLPESSVWTILLGWTMCLVCAQQFLRAAAYVFYVTWFPTFLQLSRDASEEEAGYLTAFPLLGVVLGAALGGFLLDWIYQQTGNKQLSRQGVAVVSLIGCGIFVSICYFTSGLMETAIWLACGSFCAGLAAPAAYTTTIDLGGRHVATVFATMNMVGNFGAALMPLVVPRLVRAYSWDEALLLVAGLYFAAAGCWTLLKIEEKGDGNKI